jgi:hypothetical protein
MAIKSDALNVLHIGVPDAGNVDIMLQSQVWQQTTSECDTQIVGTYKLEKSTVLLTIAGRGRTYYVFFGTLVILLSGNQ